MRFQVLNRQIFWLERNKVVHTIIFRSKAMLKNEDRTKSRSTLFIVTFDYLQSEIHSSGHHHACMLLCILNEIELIN